MDMQDDEDLLVYANDPSQIANAEMARAVLEALDRASASIQASLDTAHLRAQAEGIDAVDEQWFHRASNALHHIEYKQRRVGKRLKKLEPKDTQGMSPEKSAGKIELERIRQQTHLESMRLALEAKQLRTVERDAHQRARERLFIDKARETLPKEVYFQIWRDVDAAMLAQGIDAQSGETRSGSTESEASGESPVANGDAS